MNCLCVTAMMSWWYDDDVIMMSCCMWFSYDVISSFALVYFSYTVKEDARWKGQMDSFVSMSFHGFLWVDFKALQSRSCDGILFGI